MAPFGWFFSRLPRIILTRPAKSLGIEEAGNREASRNEEAKVALARKLAIPERGVPLGAKFTLRRVQTFSFDRSSTVQIYK
jgi:hypothetical protein